MTEEKSEPKPKHGDPVRVEQVVAFAGDPNRLMEGENPDTAERDDAEHWALVYRELANFKRGLIDLTRAEAAKVREAESEVAIDLQILEAELTRLEKRRDWWVARAAGETPPVLN